MTNATQVKWHIRGDYFENCTCDVMCRCAIAPEGPLKATPPRGYCDIVLAFHIDRGSFGDVGLDGFNVVTAAATVGPMGSGNWKLAMYLDERAGESQREALQTIFSGAAGGPMAAFAPLVGEVVGVKQVPIEYHIDGKRRSVTIPGIAEMGVQPLESMYPDGREVWIALGYPISPERIAAAVGVEGSTYTDYDWTWDNSGRNGHYAPIEWSGP